MALQPALFLDRDGVIIENRANYVRSWDDVTIYPQALAALAKIRDSPYRIVIVTNQSGIGRGFFSQEAADAVNARLVADIERKGGRIDAVFMCPHAPNDHCPCRKPAPGLLLQAAEHLEIDLPRSILIGDALTDLDAGLAAEVGQVALVRTGRGADQEQLADAARFQPLLVFDTLSQALSGLIDSRT